MVFGFGGFISHNCRVDNTPRVKAWHEVCCVLLKRSCEVLRMYAWLLKHIFFKGLLGNVNGLPMLVARSGASPRSSILIRMQGKLP